MNEPIPVVAGNGNVMIPTSHKDRLPRSLAYPTRAAKLSAALSEVAQLDGLSISFHGSSEHGKKIESVIRLGEAYPIVIGHFVRYHLGLSESKTAREFNGPRWQISVYAVPAELAGFASREFAAAGLPALRDWFAAKRTPLWLERSHRIAFSLALSSPTLLPPTCT